MTSQNRKTEAGFTIIELLLVVAIMGLLAAIAVSGFRNASSSMKLRGAARELNHALQLAKMRAMSTGIPHGLMIERRGGDANPDNPDRYMIFADCNRDFEFSDDDGDISNTPVFDDSSECLPGSTLDRRIVEKGVQPLPNGIYFTRFLGSTTPSGGGNSREAVVFDMMGVCYMGANNIVDGEIFMQNLTERDDGRVDRSGATIRGMSGITDTWPMDTQLKDAWK